MRPHLPPSRLLRASIAAVLALVAAWAPAAVASAVQSSAAPVPCTAGSGGEHFCDFYPAGDGISGGAPVQASGGQRVGYLNHGRNFVLCEGYGAQVGSASVYNHWWAWTEANDGAYGWVSAYYGQGGANDGPFEGVSSCAGAHGDPPGGEPAPAPAPTGQVPCSAIGSGRYNCDFYPSGDGRTGGTPVRSASGARVGYLNHGENYVFCQAKGEEIGSSTVYNDTWAYTQADNDRYGWVSAYYARGGADNGGFANVPGCGTAHGYPPGAAPAPGPRPTGPTPVSCTHTAAGQYTCDFYPAGDGLSGGAPVEAANQQGVGYLNHGRNWITCQQEGGEVTIGSDHNTWWGRTEADNGHWGWVNAVYASTGANDGPFAKAPNCKGASGTVPQGAVLAPPSGGGGGGGPTSGPGSGGAPNEIPPVYVPMYQQAGGHYGVNWLLIASIHAQETNFSRSDLPGVRSGLNQAGCCAGPTQFSIISRADTWAEYKDAFVPISGDRPKRYPLQSGRTVCLPKGGHPCVYDDFDAISGTADDLHRNGVGANLNDPATFSALAQYGASDSYASTVLNRAKAWAAGSGGSSQFANVLYESSAIKVTSVKSQAMTTRDAGPTEHQRRTLGRRQPRLGILVDYSGSARAGRHAFDAFLRAYHYARPGASYTVGYRHTRAPRRHRHHVP